MTGVSCRGDVEESNVFLIFEIFEFRASKHGSNRKKGKKEKNCCLKLFWTMECHEKNCSMVASRLELAKHISNTSAFTHTKYVMEILRGSCKQHHILSHIQVLYNVIGSYLCSYSFHFLSFFSFLFIFVLLLDSFWCCLKLEIWRKFL